MTREQFIIAQAVANCILTVNPVFNDDQPALRKGYLETVGKKVAELIGNSHMMVEDLQDILDAVTVACKG